MWKLILNEERNSLALLHVVQRCKRMRYVLGAIQTLAASRHGSFSDGLHSHSHFSPISSLFSNLLPAGWLPDSCS